MRQLKRLFKKRKKKKLLKLEREICIRGRGADAT
jgi:hypothetical protein